MSTITQIQCDINTCTDTAAFTGVETSVKSGSSLQTVKLDLCSKHKQQLINLTPITSYDLDGKTTFNWASESATR